MLFRRILYPVFILYEVIRLFFLLKNSAGIVALPVSWYAAVPVLIIVPVLLFLLTVNEQEHRIMLPLLALIKAIGLPALIVFIARTLPLATRFGIADDAVLIKSIITAVFLLLGDTVVGIYCYGRNRILCI